MAYYNKTLTVAPGANQGQSPTGTHHPDSTNKDASTEMTDTSNAPNSTTMASTPSASNRRAAAKASSISQPKPGQNKLSGNHRPVTHPGQGNPGATVPGRGINRSVTPTTGRHHTPMPHCTAGDFSLHTLSDMDTHTPNTPENMPAGQWSKEQSPHQESRQPRSRWIHSGDPKAVTPSNTNTSQKPLWNTP